MLTFRLATYQDVDLFFAWANDPVTRQNSYNQTAIDYNTHVNWFQKKIKSVGTVIYVFQNEKNEPVGQVRFDLNEITGDYLISISIDAKHRGNGYASEMLNKSSEDLLSVHPRSRIIAHVFVSNEASYRSFLKANYKLMEQKEISGVNSYILERNSYEK